MKDSVKIQINSIAALERLIGGDSELELELRHSVAAAFAKKYLGSAIDQVIKHNVDDKIRDEVKTAFLKKVPGYSNSFELKNEVKELIKEELSIKTKSLIGEIVSNVLADKSVLIAESEKKIANKMQSIENNINSAATRIANELTDTLLNQRIEILANKKIKEKLGV